MKKGKDNKKDKKNQPLATDKKINFGELLNKVSNVKPPKSKKS